MVILLLTPRLFVVVSVALTDAVGLVVGLVPLSFLVHDEDALLPFIIVLGYSYPDAGDDRCERLWDSLLYSGNHCSAAIGVIASSCQFGLVLQLLEEDSGGITCHFHHLHLPLVFLFAGGIPERGLEFLNEVVPVWVSESGSSRISIVVDPKVFATMGPSVLGTLDEQGGGADHHEGGYSSELVMEHFEVGVAVAYETIHVVMLPLEGLWELHDDWPRLKEGRGFVGIPVADWSVAGWCPSGRSWDRVTIWVGCVGRCSWPASLVHVLS